MVQGMSSFPWPCFIFFLVLCVKVFLLNALWWFISRPWAYGGIWRPTDPRNAFNELWAGQLQEPDNLPLDMFLMSFWRLIFFSYWWYRVSLTDTAPMSFFFFFFTWLTMAGDPPHEVCFIIITPYHNTLWLLFELLIFNTTHKISDIF